MKISYFNHLFDTAGDSVGPINKTRTIAANLEKKGYCVFLNWIEGDPDLTSSGKESEKTTIDTRKSLKPALSPFLHEPKKILANLRIFIKGFRIIRNQKPNVIIERQVWNSAAIAVLARIFDIPLIVESAAPCLFEYRHYYGRDNVHIPFLPFLLERYTLDTAKAVFSISEVLKEHYVNDRNINGDKIYVIPNGADPDLFQPRPKEKQMIKDFGLAGKTVVGWVGSSISWSGVEKLVDVIKKTLDRRDNVAFMFVGNFNKSIFQESSLTADEIERGLVFTGIVPHDDLNRYLGCMDIVLAPYPIVDFWWASSIKIFEYMAAAKPVIATAIGQIKDIISDESDGVLLYSESADEMVEKIVYLIDHPGLRKEIGARAREKIISEYTWDRITGKMSTIISNVCVSDNVKRKRLQGKTG